MKKFIDRLKQKKISTFTIMCVITVVFIILPLVMKIPFVSNLIAWIMSALKYQEYKSAYLGIIGGLVGSWLAITGAIYTQRKFDEERKKEEKDAKKQELYAKYGITIIMCKELLWNEIRANHHSVMIGNGEFLKAVDEERTHYHFLGKRRFRLENWLSIREKVINDNLECAIKVMGLYKYYEFLASFDGSAKEAKDLSQIDFSKYVEIYKDVTRYLGIEE